MASSEHQQTTTEHETSLAARNAVKLLSSLIATLLVAVSVRFWIPRALGPEAFGKLHFAESLAVMLLLFATLGVDTYIRKESADEIRTAEAYFGGVLVLRLAVELLLCGVLAAVLFAMGKDAQAYRLTFIFAAWQAIKLTNESFASLLHTAGKIGVISLAKPLLKLLWGVAMVAGLLMWPRVEVVALIFLGAEAFKSLVYLRIVKHELKFDFTVHLAPAWRVVQASFPFFLNYLVHRIYERLDVQMLTVMAGDAEVGFYGAAANLALAGLLFIPVVNSVVLPMASRIAASSEDSMNVVMRGAVRLMIVFGVLPSLMMILYREPIVSLAFGAAYAPTSSSLAVLGVLFPLTYVAILGNLHLIQLGRVWTVTRISIAGLVANPLLNWFLIPWGLSLFGKGGGGVGAAIATAATELLVVLLMFASLGRAGVNKKLLFHVVKISLAVGAVLGTHWGLSRIFPGVFSGSQVGGLWKSPLEVGVYVGVVAITGALPVRQLWQAALKKKAG